MCVYAKIFFDIMYEKSAEYRCRATNITRDIHLRSVCAYHTKQICSEKYMFD